MRNYIRLGVLAIVAVALVSSFHLNSAPATCDQVEANLVLGEDGEFQLIFKLRLPDESYRVKGILKYGACNDNICLMPQEVSFNVKVE